VLRPRMSGVSRRWPRRTPTATTENRARRPHSSCRVSALGMAPSGNAAMTSLTLETLAVYNAGRERDDDFAVLLGRLEPGPGTAL
jgi:hypothetical protein